MSVRQRQNGQLDWDQAYYYRNKSEVTFTKYDKSENVCIYL